MTTNQQAALSAAALVVAACAGRGPAIQPADVANVESYTITMADAFLRWLDGPRTMPAFTPAGQRVIDERLVPNEDFRSPSHAQTERIDPSAILAAAADPTMPRRTVSCTVGPHTLSPTRTTPSGARACECGEKWPCSRARLDRAP